MRLLLFNLATDVDDPILGFTTSWIRALARRVEFIHVITMRAGRVEVPDNVRVYSVGKERGYSEPRRVLEFYHTLFQVLRGDSIDVCFSHMIPIFTILTAPVLKAKGIPIVTWHAHRQLTTILKLAHRFSDRMISVNDSSYPYDHDKFTALGHGIDTSLFSPDTVAPDDPPLLLSVGRLSPIKDLLTLIEAVHRVRQHGLDARCVLLGNPVERDRSYAQLVLQKTQALQLQDAVQFVGAVPNGRVVNWYRRCFVHINLCPTGALDKAVLEAMACGKPSLVANEGFLETLGRWKTHLLFRHGDSQDLAQKIESLFSLTDTERLAMGMELRQRVVERHSLERLAENLIRVFKRC